MDFTQPMIPFNFNIISKHSLASVHSSLLSVLTSSICRDVSIMQSRIQCPLNSLPMVLLPVLRDFSMTPNQRSPLFWTHGCYLSWDAHLPGLWMPQAPWAPLPRLMGTQWERLHWANLVPPTEFKPHTSAQKMWQSPRSNNLLVCGPHDNSYFDECI